MFIVIKIIILLLLFISVIFMTLIIIKVIFQVKLKKNKYKHTNIHT